MQFGDGPEPMPALLDSKNMTQQELDIINLIKPNNVKELIREASKPQTKQLNDK